jgi:hypothetical protein
MATMNVKDAAGSTVAVEKPLTPGQATMANSRPVVLASDQSALTVASHAVTNAGTFAVQAAQSGTWTVQPGNTANTTAWKMQLYDGTTALPILAGSSGAPATSAPALAVSVRDVNPNGPAAASSSSPVVAQGQQAHDAADSNNFPMKVGAKAQSSEVAAVSTGDIANLVTDLVGKLIVLPTPIRKTSSPVQLPRR